jgi:alkylation response protein AidB-like acyl-CoA dehydrogenase
MNDGDVVRVRGLVLGPRTSRTAFVVARRYGPEVVEVVEVPAAAVEVVARHGLDAELAAGYVAGVVEGATSLMQGPSAAAWWTAAQAVTRMALSHYLVGSLRTMLELARDHAVERRQFGQPIGTFQAVRHKLAEAFVAVEAAEAAAAAAWEAYDDFPLAAATAKIVASNSLAIVAAHAQQVLAGIGFTEEHPFHRSMKRAVVLDRVLGDAADLAPCVGRALMRRGGAPRLVEL